MRCKGRPAVCKPQWQWPLMLVAVMSLVLGGADPAGAELVDHGSQVTTISVLRFGADPRDNAHDDTQAMQAAANYLCNHPGNTLRYPAGVFNVNKIVNDAAQFDFNNIGIVYRGCKNVQVIGTGPRTTRIEVKGDFTKPVKPGSKVPYPEGRQTFYCHGEKPWPEEMIGCTYSARADKYQYPPFSFYNSEHFALSGFGIDGNSDQMKQEDPSVYLVEGNEYGVYVVDCHDVTIKNLNVHHMATDAISLGHGFNHEVTIDNVIMSDSSRADMHIGPSWNIQVLNSQILNAGFSGPAKDSYTAHAGAVGVTIEPESLPHDADWETGPGSPDNSHLAGNILFDNVTGRGNLNGAITSTYGNRAANVTVRNSDLASGQNGAVLAMGVVGGVVENNRRIEGRIDVCSTQGTVTVALADQGRGQYHRRAPSGPGGSIRAALVLLWPQCRVPQ